MSVILFRYMSCSPVLSSLYLLGAHMAKPCGSGPASQVPKSAFSGVDPKEIGSRAFFAPF